MRLRTRAIGVACGILFAAARVWAEPQSTESLTGIEANKLKAIHGARIQFARNRRPVFDNGVYQDYRVVIQVETAKSASDPKSRLAILKAARDAAVDAVLLATPPSDRGNAWRGLHDKVLVIAGSVGEAGAGLRFPTVDSADRPLPHRLTVAAPKSANGSGATKSTNQTDALDLWADIGFEKSQSAMFSDGTRAAASSDSLTASLLEVAKSFPDELLGANSWHNNGGLRLFDSELDHHHLSAVATSQGHDEIRVGKEALDSYSARFRHLTTHVLCRDLTEPEVVKALAEGRSYLSHDWLCDPTSFAFVGVHNLGVFNLGDAAPANVLLGGGTTFIAATPVPAHLKLFHKNRMVAETRSARLDFDATDPGAYRVEAWLEVAGEERLWILSNPIYLDNSIVSTTKLPPAEKPDGVEVERGIVYSDAPSPDRNKHMLDVYSPKGRKNSPVFFFIHGGAWRFGDRTQFFPVGNRFAREGFVTVIPSYRLAPRSRYPAQIEDCAAAFAWTIREISRFGGDTNRIYVGGHSAGGHLAALLALDPKQLGAVGVSPKMIKGVIGLSGVYDLNAIGTSQSEVFGDDPKFRRDASPMTYVNSNAPPFLVTYCEHDYFSLPAQAKAFEAELRTAKVKTQLWFSPGENHVAEIYSFCIEGDPTGDEMLRFMRR